MASAASAAAADYTCSYCLEYLKSMVDPRRLPCGHVFCLECLTSDFSAGVNNKCPQCNVVHEDLDLGELPEVDSELEVKEQEEVKVSKYPPVYCSLQCDHVAISFCGDCSSKLCQTHKEAHDTFLGPTHKYVPFEEYRRLPEKYDTPLCVQHNRPLSLACEVCDKIVCNECDLTSSCDQYNNSHKLKSLAKLKKKLTDEYGEFIKSISKMHSQFRTKEKEMFYRFEELVATYEEDEKLKAIDRVADEQIAEIQRRCEIKKKHVKGFPAKMDAKVTTYAEKLQEKEQQLGDLEKSLSLLMKESHITRIIRENKGNRERIEQAKKLTTGNCEVLREMVVAPTGYLRDAEVLLRRLVPTKLVKFFSGSSSESVQHLTLTDKGELLCYSQSGAVKVMDTHCQVIRASLSIPNVISLAQCKDTVFVVTFENKNLVCTSYSYYKLTKLKKICQFRTECSYHSTPQIAVWDDYIAVVDNSSYSFRIHVYNQSGSHCTIACEAKITGIWSLPGGNILIKNAQSEVLRWEIKSSTVTKLGTNDHLAMTTDSAGLLYSSTYNSGRSGATKIAFSKLHKSDMKVVGELASQETRNISGISVKNNILAVTDNNSRVNLYHLGY